jgi:flagellar FliL protein
MGDKDRFLEEEETPAQGGDEAEVGKRVGVLPSLVLKILKWVAIVVALIILVVLVVVIVYNMLNGDRSAMVSQISTSTDMEAVAPTLQYFTNVGQIRGLTIDNPPASYIAEVDLGYEQGNNALTAELNDKAKLIHNQILIFLSKKLASQLHPSKAGELQAELLPIINRWLMTGKIQAVLFREITPITG